MASSIPSRDERWAISSMLSIVAKCRNLGAVETHFEQPRTLTMGASASGASFSVNIDFDTIYHSSDGRALLRELASSAPSSDVKAFLVSLVHSKMPVGLRGAAIEAMLRGCLTPTDAEIPRPNLPNLELVPAYRMWLRVDRPSALAALMANLESPAMQYNVVEILGEALPDRQILDRLRVQIASNAPDADAAAAILAMSGSYDDIAYLLNKPSRNVRDSISNNLRANPLVKDILSEIRRSTLDIPIDWSALEKEERAADAFLHEISEISPEQRPWRADFMLRSRDQIAEFSLSLLQRADTVLLRRLASANCNG
jgi:hypothetical protein